MATEFSRFYLTELSPELSRSASNPLLRDRQVVASDMEVWELHLEHEIENDTSIASTERESHHHGPSWPRPIQRLHFAVAQSHLDRIILATVRSHRLTGRVRTVEAELPGCPQRRTDDLSTLKKRNSSTTAKCLLRLIRDGGWSPRRDDHRERECPFASRFALCVTGVLGMKTSAGSLNRVLNFRTCPNVRLRSPVMNIETALSEPNWGMRSGWVRFCCSMRNRTTAELFGRT